MKLALLAFATLFAALPAFAEVSRDGTIDIQSAWARIAPNEDGTVSVFFEVLNMGEHTDALVSASSPVAKKVSLRKGKWSGLDFFNREEDGIRVKANRRTSFKPGQLEVALSNLTNPIPVGAEVPVTLVFKEAGPVPITATISNQLLGNRFRKN
jgi:copper(I)-binding protein